MSKMTEGARRAVKDFALVMGTSKKDFQNVPLHYTTADLVAGLMLLAKKEGLNFSDILRDAKNVTLESAPVVKCAECRAAALPHEVTKDGHAMVSTANGRAIACSEDGRRLNGGKPWQRHAVSL